jgi:sarcosine oxidase
MNTDVLVVGLGAMGSATLYQLARRGVKAIGIDRYHPPHVYGSTHGETRITRQAIGEGEAYVPFVLRSHQIWRELEATTGQELFLACGGLILSGETGKATHHSKPEFLKRTIQAAQKFGIEHELLNTAQMAQRFPQLGLHDQERGYWEPGAGLVYPERCIEAQLGQARALGATLRMGEKVVQVTPAKDGVTVRTDQQTYHAGKVIVSAGPWVAELLGEPVAKAVKIFRQVLFWFEAQQPELYAPERFPIFIWTHGEQEGQHFYGFPDVGSGVKVATEQDWVTTAPDSVERDVAEAEIVQMFEGHAKGRLKGLQNKLLKSATCLYTSTPDGDFILDQHPDSECILIASPCSGHGFKHSAAVGEAMAEWSLEGRTRFDLTTFAISRFAQT